VAWNAHFKGEPLDHITPNQRFITLEGTVMSEEIDLDEVSGGGETEESTDDE
jgi:hypothetical protein